MTESFELVPVDGATLWSVRQGCGVPLVLCHGGPGMWDYLGAVATLIDDLVTVVRYDQRACGRSSGASDYAMATAIADLDDVRDYFGFDQWIVGGHSFGASLALAYSLKHPERTTGLIYVSGTGIDPGWHAAYRANRAARLGPAGLRRFSELREQIARSQGDEKAVLQAAYSELYRETDLADPMRAAEINRLLDADGRRVNDDVNRILGADAGRTIESEGIRARIARLSVPALLVHGESDPRPLASVRTLSEVLPNARLEVIAGAGHFPWFEQPDVFRTILRNFLRSLHVHE